MAITAAVTNIDASKPDVLAVTVEYRDGAVLVLTEVHKTFAKPAADWLARTAKATIDRLEGLKAAGIVVGPIDTSGVTDTPPAEVDYMREVGRAQILATMLTLGVVKATDQKYIDYVALLRANILTYWSKL